MSDNPDMPRALFAVFVVLCATVASAATPLRVLRAFDFEERVAGNVEDLPMDWVKVVGRGYPHYVNGTLAIDAAHTGRYAFRLDLNGGNVAYRYPAGKIPVHPHAHYDVTVQCRTQGLVNARAQLTAFFADARGTPLRETVTRSDPQAGTPGDWTPLSVQLDAPDDAVSVVVELALLQASVWRRASPGEAALLEQDVHGRAWFDDLTVRQVPQVRLTCDAVGNVFRKSEPTSLLVSLNDRLTRDLVGRLVVVDAAERPVFQQTGTFDLLPAGDAERQVRLALPPLPAGWYRAQVRFESGGTPVGHGEVDFVRLADDGGVVRPDGRFGTVATKLPFAAWDTLPDVLPLVGVSRVKLSVWSDRGDAESVPGLQFDRLLDRLEQRQIAPTGCFTGVPPSIAAAVGGKTWQHVAAAPPGVWQPQLALFASRYAGHVGRWQFGDDELATAFVDDAALRRAYALVLGPMADLFHPPDLAMPWPAWHDPQPGVPPHVALSVPCDVLPEQLPAYVDDVRRGGRPEAALTLTALDPDRYGRPAFLRDLAQRIGYAAASAATRIDLPLPFRQDATPSCGQPTESLLVQRTLLAHLGNTVYRGRMPLGPDVDALLFDRDGEGVVLLWTKSPQAKPTTVPVMLGREPHAVNLWGNVSPVLRPRSADGTTDVTVGPTPSLLIGIDGPLARLRAGFSFDNPLVESSFKPHVRRLRFANPYDRPITGRLRLIGPQGWTVTPLEPSFTLPAGAAYDAAVTIEFPYHSVAGEKPITCDVTLDGDPQARFQVPLAMKLGLGDVGLTTTAFRDGNDVVVQQMITNYSGQPINYTAFATYPGAARQERLLDHMAGGTTTIKRYRFLNAVPGKTVKSGLRETEGTRVLNDEVAVP